MNHEEVVNVPYVHRTATPADPATGGNNGGNNGGDNGDNGGDDGMS